MVLIVEIHMEEYCQKHEAPLDEEIICQRHVHYCSWCKKPIGPCTCFNNFTGSPEEFTIIKNYISNLESLFERTLDPTEKRAVIQQYIDLREG